MVKVTVNLSEDLVEALRAIANRRGITMTEVIRRAVANAKFFDEELDAGSRVMVERKGERPREILFR